MFGGGLSLKSMFLLLLKPFILLCQFAHSVIYSCCVFSFYSYIICFVQMFLFVDIKGGSRESNVQCFQTAIIREEINRRSDRCIQECWWS